MARLLRGAPVAEALTEALSERAAALRAAGVVPTLRILRVGEQPDDLLYENVAARRCERIGIEVQRVTLPADCGREALLDAVRAVNADPAVHGCLLLRPLADWDTETAACALLDPAKDVDGMTAGSMAAVFTGAGVGFAPCTAEAVIALLEGSGVELEGKRAVVIGRSLVIGRPLAMLLLQGNATVTVCHTRTRELAEICRGAELLVAAAGRPGLVPGDWIAPGQTVVDVGVHVLEDGSLCGDVRFDEAAAVAEAVTPVPGGVGAVTTTVLAKHVIEAAEQQTGRYYYGDE